SSTRRSTSRVDFFFSAPAAPEIYPLSLHDALPIWGGGGSRPGLLARAGPASAGRLVLGLGARPRRGGPVGRGHGRRGDGPAHGGGPRVSGHPRRGGGGAHRRHRGRRLVGASARLAS